jgi:hypothetical protein
MQLTKRRMAWAITIVVVALLLAVGFALSRPADTAESWKPAPEGFLAVATPCCTEASLWDELDSVTADGQRARPASAAEAAQWLNDWPYRSRGEHHTVDEEQLRWAAQSSEVRCVGAPSGPEFRPEGDDEETLNAVHFRRECSYARWRIWAAGTPENQPNERHTVWADEDGLFRGRVDYWK